MEKKCFLVSRLSARILLLFPFPPAATEFSAICAAGVGVVRFSPRAEFPGLLCPEKLHKLPRDTSYANIDIRYSKKAPPLYVDETTTLSRGKYGRMNRDRLNGIWKPSDMYSHAEEFLPRQGASERRSLFFHSTPGGGDRRLENKGWCGKMYLTGIFYGFRIGFRCWHLRLYVPSECWIMNAKLENVGCVCMCVIVFIKHRFLFLLIRAYVVLWRDMRRNYSYALFYFLQAFIHTFGNTWI